MNALLHVGLCVALAMPAVGKTKLVVWGLPSGEWTHGRDVAIAASVVHSLSNLV